MSLSNPKPQNPCKKFIEFKADIGVFRYWDKDKKDNVELPYPLSFIVLDELATITGFCDQTQSGIYSNEVRNLTNNTLNVRTFKGGLKVIGKYADIKADISNLGGKFCKSVYVALINGGDVELANFQLKGISFKSWLDKDVDITKNAVIVSECTDGQKGRVKYKVPLFKSEPVKKDVMDKAVAMDKFLQDYLELYEESQHFEQNKLPAASEGKQADAEKDDDIPF